MYLQICDDLVCEIKKVEQTITSINIADNIETFKYLMGYKDALIDTLNRVRKLC